MLMGITHAFGSTAFIALVLKLPMYSPLVLESSHHIANSAQRGWLAIHSRATRIARARKAFCRSI
jgi:hypothetical protein